MSNTTKTMPTQTSSVLHNDTVSSCSTSKVQEKTQLLRSRCMNSLREIKSQFKFLIETFQDIGTLPIFKRTFSQDLDLLEQQLTKYILSQTDCNTTLTKLIITFKNAFNIEFKERNVKKFVAKRTCHQRQYDRRVNKRHMHTQESKTDMGKALDVELVVTESSGTKSKMQDDSSRSCNDTDAEDTNIRPIYDEEQMAETIEKTTSLLANNADLKAYIQENVFAIAALKDELRKLKGNSRIFKSVGVRWVPRGKILASCTSKADSEPTHGSNVDISKIHECKQTLDLSASTSINVKKEQSFYLSAESTSNSSAVGDLQDSIWIEFVTIGYRFGPLYELLTQSER
ncbi:hypothetical protein Tco_1447099 [Tanacetum coccineum]